MISISTGQIWWWWVYAEPDSDGDRWLVPAVCPDSQSDNSCFVWPNGHTLWTNVCVTWPDKKNNICLAAPRCILTLEILQGWTLSGAYLGVGGGGVGGGLRQCSVCVHVWFALSHWHVSMNNWMNEWMNEWMDEWMNEYLTTPQHKVYIGYWVSDKRMNKWMNEWIFNNTPAQSLHWLLGVRQKNEWIKEPLLLIGKSSPCCSSGFPFLLSEWSITICLTPYNPK